MAKLTVNDLQQMKVRGEKIRGLICYDNQLAQIADQAGADIISVGDSLGRYVLGHQTHHEVTVDHMVLFCGAVARGVKRAVVNCDMPFGPPQAGPAAARDAAIRLVKEGHADMIKIDGAAKNLDVVEALVRAGIPVFTQFGFSPQSTLSIGDQHGRTEEMLEAARPGILEDAKRLEAAGASLLDVTHVTTEIYAEISAAVSIPVLGGGAGPEADGRIGGLFYRAAAIGQGGSASSATAAFMLETAKRLVEETKSKAPRAS